MMKKWAGFRRSLLAAATYGAVGLMAAGGQAAMAQSQCESVVGNLVTNCGFETQAGGNPTGWTTGGPNGVSLALSGVAHTGVRSLVSNFDAPGGTFINQAVGGAGTYDVSFWLDLYSQGVPSNPVPTIAITFGDQTLNVNPVIDNKQDPQYTQFLFPNVTTAAPAVLQFATSGNLTNVQYVNFLVDDVVVTLISSPVPEPSALALALTALAALAMVRRRQQATRA